MKMMIGKILIYLNLFDLCISFIFQTEFSKFLTKQK